MWVSEPLTYTMIQFRIGKLKDNTLLYKTAFLLSALTAQLFSKSLEQVRKMSLEKSLRETSAGMRLLHSH